MLRVLRKLPCDITSVTGFCFWLFFGWLLIYAVHTRRHKVAGLQQLSTGRRLRDVDVHEHGSPMASGLMPLPAVYDGGNTVWPASFNIPNGLSSLIPARSESATSEV